MLTKNYCYTSKGKNKIFHTIDSIQTIYNYIMEFMSHYIYLVVTNKGAHDLEQWGLVLNIRLYDKSAGTNRLENILSGFRVSREAFLLDFAAINFHARVHGALRKLALRKNSSKYFYGSSASSLVEEMYAFWQDLEKRNRASSHSQSSVPNSSITQNKLLIFDIVRDVSEYYTDGYAFNTARNRAFFESTHLVDMNHRKSLLTQMITIRSYVGMLFNLKIAKLDTLGPGNTEAEYQETALKTNNYFGNLAFNKNYYTPLKKKSKIFKYYHIVASGKYKQLKEYIFSTKFKQQWSTSHSQTRTADPVSLSLFAKTILPTGPMRRQGADSGPSSRPCKYAFYNRMLYVSMLTTILARPRYFRIVSGTMRHYLSPANPSDERFHYYLSLSDNRKTKIVRLHTYRKKISAQYNMYVFGLFKYYKLIFFERKSNIYQSALSEFSHSQNAQFVQNKVCKHCIIAGYLIRDVNKKKDVQEALKKETLESRLLEAPLEYEETSLLNPISIQLKQDLLSETALRFNEAWSKLETYLYLYFTKKQPVIKEYAQFEYIFDHPDQTAEVLKLHPEMEKVYRTIVNYYARYRDAGIVDYLNKHLHEVCDFFVISDKSDKDKDKDKDKEKEKLLPTHSHKFNSNNSIANRDKDKVNFEKNILDQTFKHVSKQSLDTRSKSAFEGSEPPRREGKHIQSELCVSDKSLNSNSHSHLQSNLHLTRTQHELDLHHTYTKSQCNSLNLNCRFLLVNKNYSQDQFKYRHNTEDEFLYDETLQWFFLVKLDVCGTASSWVDYTPAHWRLEDAYAEGDRFIRLYVKKKDTLNAKTLQKISTEMNNILGMFLSYFYTTINGIMDSNDR